MCDTNNNSPRYFDVLNFRATNKAMLFGKGLQLLSAFMRDNPDAISDLLEGAGDIMLEYAVATVTQERLRVGLYSKEQDENRLHEIAMVIAQRDCNCQEE